MRLAIVTATTNLVRAQDCLRSWYRYAASRPDLYVVLNGDHTSVTEASAIFRDYPATALTLPEIVGVVPAFALGVQRALADGAEIIACFHDDLEIAEGDWDRDVIQSFERNPQLGLAGFGGGLGLGSGDLYTTPYNPMQLARQGFVSNMRDAEAHGTRIGLPVQVSCLDGFSQIGRREFWTGLEARAEVRLDPAPAWYAKLNLFNRMEALGVIHHFYDGMLGCYAARLGWETWMLPIKCHHYGGRTAVGDAAYATWAELQGGDAKFWEDAHRIGYTEFRDVLPLRKGGL